MRKVLDQMYPSGILKAIMAERKFQDEKYGTVDREGGHELGAWLIIIEKELDEAKDALVHGGNKRIAGRNSIRAEIIQVAAVCFAALEQHGITEIELAAADTPSLPIKMSYDCGHCTSGHQCLVENQCLDTYLGRMCGDTGKMCEKGCGKNELCVRISAT